MFKRSILILITALCLLVGAKGQTFFETLGEPSRDERALVAYHSPANMLFIGGSIGDSALIQRVDQNGTVIWARTFKPPGQYPKHVYHLISAPDGTLIGCGNGVTPAQEPTEGFHFRFDVDGNMIWVRHWDDAKAYNRRIQPLSSTEYLLFSDYYDLGSATAADLFQARVDAATGDVLWTSDRLDLFSAVPYIDDIVSAISLHASHYASGRIFTNGSPLSTCRVFLSKFDHGGEHLWTRYLLYPNSISRRMYGTDIVASNDSLTMSYFGDVTGASSNFTVGLIHTDTLGNVAWARNYDIGSSSQEVSSKVIATSFGYLLVGRGTSPGAQRMFLLAVSFTGDVLWAKSYGPLGQIQTFPHFYTMNLTDVGTGFMLTGVVQSGGDEDMLIALTDADGNIDCGIVNALTVTASDLPTDHFFPLVTSIAQSNDLGAVPIAVLPASLNSSCSAQLDLGSDTTVCAPLVLQAGLPGATFLWQDGSTADSLIVSATGTYWIAASVGCCTATDSITVTFSGSIGTVQLGSDTLLCPGEQVVLTTTIPNADHVWQDGSTDSDLVVSSSGTYWVAVGPAGCSVSDTIEVLYVEPALIDLGSDTVMCEGEPLTLDVPPSVLDPIWQDGSSGYEFEVSQSGAYWVNALSDGCPVVDSVNVAFQEPPFPYLGPDTLVCPGSEIVLATGLTGSPHLWQDGSSDAEFSVTYEGVYWVLVGTNGCTGVDSIVISMPEVPNLDLGIDTVLCGPATMELEVDTGNWIIEWSDGTSGAILGVNEPGVYWVSVISQGCQISDTIQVDTLSAPSAVLGADTVSCGGDAVELSVSADQVEQILWSTGSTLESIVAEYTGVYWIEVENACGSASDTIHVEIVPELFVDLGPDTSICGLPLIELVSGYPASVSFWSDGTQSGSFVISEPGVFWVEVNNSGCSTSDTIAVLSATLPFIALPRDTTVCALVPFAMPASSNESDQITWQDGTVGPEYWVSGEGVYTASAVNACGVAADSIVVALYPSPPMLQDRSICLGERAHIELVDALFDVQWDTQDSGNAISLGEGEHWYVATDAYGCWRTDTVLVVLDPANDGVQYVPNVFTPNSDGFNDTFLVTGAERGEFEMSIFDRWGILLYLSHDPLEGWAGNARSGGSVPDGTYVYLIKTRSTCEAGSAKSEHIGHVTLLR